MLVIKSVDVPAYLKERDRALAMWCEDNIPPTGTRSGDRDRSDTRSCLSSCWQSHWARSNLWAVWSG